MLEREFNQVKLDREFNDIIQSEMNANKSFDSSTNDSFYDKLDELKPVFTAIVLMEYQKYFSELLKREVTEDEIRRVLKYRFEDLRGEDFFTLYDH
jgi:hypothetical protein